MADSDKSEGDIIDEITGQMKFCLLYTSLPDSRMHKYGRVDPDNVFVQQHHAVPPAVSYTHLGVIEYRNSSLHLLALPAVDYQALMEPVR